MHKCKNGRRDAHSSFKKHSIHAAVVLAFGPALSLQAGAQSYLNYDGSRSGDLGAAAATWANAAEFKSDWGLGALNAQFAYALGFSGAGVKTGAVDSGYLPTHQEFASRGITGVVVSGTKLRTYWLWSSSPNLPTTSSSAFCRVNGKVVPPVRKARTCVVLVLSMR